MSRGITWFITMGTTMGTPLSTNFFFHLPPLHLSSQKKELFFGRKIFGEAFSCPPATPPQIKRMQMRTSKQVHPFSSIIWWGGLLQILINCEISNLRYCIICRISVITIIYGLFSSQISLNTSLSCNHFQCRVGVFLTLYKWALNLLAPELFF